MAQGLSFQPDGLTTMLSVTNSSHSAVTISSVTGGAQNLYIVNSGTVAVAFNVNPNGTAVAATLGTDGSTGIGFVVPGGVAKVFGPFGPSMSVTAIGAAAGPTVCYLTPGFGGAT